MKKLLPLLLLVVAHPAFAIAWTDPLGPGEVTVQTAAGRVLGYILGLVGVLGLCGYVYGGFLWMIASGDSKKVGEARSVIVWTTVGMTTIIFSYAIVSFLVSSLASTTNPSGGSSGGTGGGPAATGGQCPDGAAEACTNQANNNTFDFGTCTCKFGNLLSNETCNASGPNAGDDECTSKIGSQCASGSRAACVRGGCACLTFACVGQFYTQCMDTFTVRDGECFCAASGATGCQSNADCSVTQPCSIGVPQCVRGSCYCSPL